MKTTNDSIGARVKAALGDMTQGELAEALGVKQPHLSRMFNRASYNDRARSMQAIAAALGVSVRAYLDAQREHGNGDEAELARQLADIAGVLGVEVETLLPG